MVKAFKGELLEILAHHKDRIVFRSRLLGIHQKVEGSKVQYEPAEPWQDLVLRDAEGRLLASVNSTMNEDYSHEHRLHLEPEVKHL